MNPYTDFGFKKLFGTLPNKDILISFLNALFDGDRKTIVDLNFLNTEVLGPYYGDRNSVFDVYCIPFHRGDAALRPALFQGPNGVLRLRIDRTAGT